MTANNNKTEKGPRKGPFFILSMPLFQGIGPKYDEISRIERIIVLRRFAILLRTGAIFTDGKEKKGRTNVGKIVSGCNCGGGLVDGLLRGMPCSPYHHGGAMDFGRNIKTWLKKRNVWKSGKDDQTNNIVDDE